MRASGSFNHFCNFIVVFGMFMLAIQDVFGGVSPTLAVDV